MYFSQPGIFAFDDVPSFYMNVDIEKTPLINKVIQAVDASTQIAIPLIVLVTLGIRYIIICQPNVLSGKRLNLGMTIVIPTITLGWFNWAWEMTCMQMRCSSMDRLRTCGANRYRFFQQKGMKIKMSFQLVTLVIPALC